MLKINKENEKYLAQETLPAIILLTLNSGFIDGNTFLYNNQRFGGMQTGNVIQAGLHIAKHQFGTAMSFLFPFFAFILGIFLSTIIRHLYKNHSFLVFEQISLTIQIIGILIMAFVEKKIPDTLQVSGLSFFMALQADSFSKLHGGGIATVFTTGNTKTFAANIMNGFLHKSSANFIAALKVLLVIFGFFIGAIGAELIHSSFGDISLFVSPILLIAVLGHITFHRNK
ncbi:MAG: DUF1275 domain-containing protein [Lactobacillaceae bacterium]|jgi:uncharacterized membrane protein YoaK (UPF0700 family)|nr:DUF1275 domain-containing protein [Lactobacillaceae bacterium]